MPDRAAPRGADLVERYLSELQTERNLSPYTLRNYRSDLFFFLAAIEDIGQQPLEITRQSFRAYLARLNAAGVTRASIARRISTIHTFYRYLAREGLLAGDPLAGISPPRRERRLPRFLEKDQMPSLLQAPSGDDAGALRDRAMLELLYAAGLRVSELVGLNLPDVDRSDWLLRVQGKGNKTRTALFGGHAAEVLDQYLRMGRPQLERDATTALFLNRRGGRISVRAVELLVRKYSALAGISQHVFPHLFRHSFATHMLDAGADVRIVQELLGHESAATTQIYTHVTEERQREVYTRAFYNEWRPKSERPSGRLRGKNRPVAPEPSGEDH